MGFLKRSKGRKPALGAAGDVVALRSLLLSEEDPMMRHVVYGELERCLWEARHEFTSALDEFDDACLEHDREMDAIRAALLRRSARLPVIELYGNAARRCRLAQDWRGVARWTERGLEVYGEDAGPRPSTSSCGWPVNPCRTRGFHPAPAATPGR
jgi:hypothetical protein